METDLRACSAGPGTLAGRPRASDREAETGLPPIVGPGRPAVATTVSHFLFPGDANITRAWQHPADPFGAISFPRIEFHLIGLAGRFGNLTGSSGECAGGFPGQWHITGPEKPERMAIAGSVTGHAEVRG